MTHGSPANISGTYFNIVPYGVSAETEVLDYDEMEKIALACKPKMIVSGASAIPASSTLRASAKFATKRGL